MTCQPSDAAGAVAALFGFAAVGVVDKVVEVSVWLFWRRYDEQLVEAVCPPRQILTSHHMSRGSIGASDGSCIFRG